MVHSNRVAMEDNETMASQRAALKNVRTMVSHRAVLLMPEQRQ